MSALGMKLNKDELRVAGVEMKDQSMTDTLTAEHHKAGTINTSNLIINTQEGIDVLNQDVTVNTYNLNAGTGNVIIGGVEDTTTTTHTDKTKTTTVSVGVKNAYVDAAYALDAVVKAGEALKAAKDELSWAKREIAAGRMANSVIHDYEINLTAATLNLTQANIAAFASMVNAAQTAKSSAGTGFYVSGKAEHSTETNKNANSQGIWNGSTFNAASGGTITGDTLGIQGSAANLGNVDVQVETIDMISGVEHNSSSSQYRKETQTVTASSGSGDASGSGGVSISTDKSDSSSKGTHHVNSVVNIGTLTGNVDTLAIKGGDVTIDDQQATIKEISVTSEQDTQTSKNSGSGWSANMGGGAGGVSSVGGGISRSNGYADSAIVNDQSSLIINKGADLDKAGVTKITNVGGIIASGTRAEDGSIVDNGTLNYTGELVQQDIYDYSHNKQAGFNFSTSIGNTEEGKPPQGTTTFGVQNTGSQMAQTTKSVMGLGTVTNANENRDVNNAQEITKDQVTGALNATATIDNRWATEEGRASIVDDAKHFLPNVKAATGGATEDLLHVTGTHSAYEVMFDNKADMYVLVYENGQVKLGDDGKPMRRKLTEDETQHLQKSSDGKVYIADNGIFNDQAAAAKYADQNGVDRPNEAHVDRTQYFIEFKPADNAVAELLVAGYQKFLEGNFWGLANPTQRNKDMINLYGTDGLGLDGHSRGSMTINNAMQSLVDEGAVGVGINLKVNFFGPAANVKTADHNLSILQDRDFIIDVDAYNSSILHYQNHKSDPVGTLFFVGNNEPTGGNNSKKTSTVGEMLNALGGESTVHNCYGKGNDLCKDAKYWKNSPTKLPIFIPVTPYRIDSPTTGTK